MFFYEVKGNALIVTLARDLDHSAVTQIRPVLDALIEDTGVRRLVFDLKDLDFMDSSGIGLIIGRYKLMARRGGSVGVRGTDERIDKILGMAGLYQIVERLA